MQYLGLPELEELVRLDGAPLEQGVPTYLVKSARWDGWPNDLYEDYDSDDLPDDICLIDLGEAFPHDVVPEILAQPSGLQAPETVLVGKFDYRVDLWRCGLIVRPFHPKPDKSTKITLDLLSGIRILPFHVLLHGELDKFDDSLLW